MLFENEDEIESTSDVTPETSSESQDDAQSESAELSQEAKQAAPTPKEPPFHEHPRWIERQNELNAERQARLRLESQIAEMQRQFQESQKPKSTAPDFKDVSAKMHERLKGIDPDFQMYMSQLEQQALTAQEQLSKFREEQFVERAVSKIQDLNKSNNITPEMAPFYEAQLDKAYREGKIRSMEDVEKVYKSVHEPFAKMLEAREKAYLEKYTASKKADASKPAAQPKGKAANPAGRKTYANSQEETQALIKDVAAQMRAARNGLG